MVIGFQSCNESFELLFAELFPVESRGIMAKLKEIKRSDGPPASDWLGDFSSRIASTAH